MITRRSFSRSILARIVAPSLMVSAVPTSLNLKNNEMRLAAWGSSTIRYLSNDGIIDKIARDMNLTEVFHGGKGGELSSHIAARLGSRPILLEFPNNTIPHGGSCVVTTDNVPLSRSFRSSLVSVDGVIGELSVSKSDWIWRRINIGAVHYLNGPTQALPVEGDLWKGAYFIGNMGKNDIASSADNIDDAISLSITTIDWLKSYTPLQIWLTNYSDTHWKGKDHPKRGAILRYNRWLRSVKGITCVDLGGYITSQRIFTDLNISPTAEDASAIIDGRLPPSLGRDNSHLNIMAENAFYDYILRPQILKII